MTKLYGSLVGAPVQSLQASGAGFVSDRYKDGHDQVLCRDYATTSNNVIGDAISLGLYPSTAFLDPYRCVCAYDSFGAGVIANIGDATYPNVFYNPAGVPIAVASGVRLFSPIQSGAYMRQPLWQRLGYPSDPGRPIELLWTFTGANPASGMSVCWQIYGRRD